MVDIEKVPAGGDKCHKVEVQNSKWDKSQGVDLRLQAEFWRMGLFDVFSDR